MSFERIGKILKAKDTGVAQKTLEASFVCDAFTRALKDITPDVSEMVQEISFTHGQIKLKIKSASAASELMQKSKAIIEKTNIQIRVQAVERVLFKLC